MKKYQYTFFSQLAILFLVVAACSSNDDTSEETVALEIGQAYQGGIIFYLDDSGEHGLIALQNDLEVAEWGCTANQAPIAQGHTIGTGEANTQAIVNYCDEDVYAAKLCADLVQNGYDDWFLPSIDELGLVYEHKDAIGGFANEEYWVYSSSTEGFNGCSAMGGPPCYLNSYVWDFSITPVFEDTRKITSSKVSGNRVRPIRSF